MKLALIFMALLLPLGVAAQSSCVQYSYGIQTPFGAGGNQNHDTGGHSFLENADWGCDYTGGPKLPNGNYQCLVDGLYWWEPASFFETGQVFGFGHIHYTGGNNIRSVADDGYTSTTRGNVAFSVNDCPIGLPGCVAVPIGFDPVTFNATFYRNIGQLIMYYQLPANDHHYCPSEIGGPGTPIVVDLDGKDFNGAFTSIEEGVVWDFFGNGHDLHMAWTNPDRNIWFLVLDRNHNGVIDNAHELFGNITLQPLDDAEQIEAKAMYDSDRAAGVWPRPYPLHGFRALKYLKRSQPNNNGEDHLDSRDSVWKELRLCNFRPPHTDIAANCQTLDEAGIKSISLRYSTSDRIDQYGNQMSYMGSVQMVKPGPITPTIYDVTFQYR